MTEKRMTKETPLLPCPFCGGEVRVQSAIHTEGDSRALYADCSNEGCAVKPTTLTYSTPEAAMAAWNTRPSQATLSIDEAVEKIKHYHAEMRKWRETVTEWSSSKDAKEQDARARAILTNLQGVDVVKVLGEVKKELSKAILKDIAPHVDGAEAEDIAVLKHHLLRGSAKVLDTAIKKHQ